MDRKDALRLYGEMLTAFPEGQTVTPDLYGHIQLILDEVVATLLASGGELPAFMTNSPRLEAIRERLGPLRMAEIAAEPVPSDDLKILTSLAAKLCSAFDLLAAPDSGSIFLKSR